MDRLSIGVPSQDFNVKDLPTKSVTLYPSRAHIVRDVNDVVLKPGANEVVIHGITPTADEHSVQIDGKGAATITDITVELVPNREIFQDIFPDPDDEESDSDDSPVADAEDPAEVKTLTQAIDALRSEMKDANEVINSTARRLETLDSYSKTLRAEKNSADDLAKTLLVYERERSQIFKLHRDASNKVEACQKSIAEKEQKKQRAWIPEKKRRAKEAKTKSKEYERKLRQRAERLKEVERVKEERLKFWPKKLYRVTVSLETASSNDTPASSRRGSMDSVTLARGYTPDLKDTTNTSSIEASDTTVSLSLSYVTRDASWSPRYDLNISSIQRVATISYRAEFVNGTSETWRDAQLILSTSQTSYQGLEDKVPFMHGWHVKLGRYQDNSLLSPEEQNKPRIGNAIAPVTNRNELFGSSQNVFTYGTHAQQVQQIQRQQIQGAFAKPQMPFQSCQSASGGLFGSAHSTAPQAPPASSLFGNVSNARSAFGSNAYDPTIEDGLHAVQVTESAQTSGYRGQSSRRAEKRAQQQEEEESVEGNLNFYVDHDGPTGGPAVGFEEASWDDHGLTSTYEVPGMRTLVPSSLTRRHKIATLQATNIHLSHIAVPKLRPSAFLRAKIRNPSGSVTLLKGTAGVTLDGSFLGNMTMSRVSPGQIFDLPLGVDPAVHINYPKPSVHRSTQGLFNKESAQLFSRSVWITNTKPVPVELLVLDQVPVSEDERLKIEVLHPRGLNKEGDVIRTGSAAKEGASGTTSIAHGNAWGKATATLKKDGQVAWTVNVEKKQACLLKLEYEAKMPVNEKITPA